MEPALKTKVNEIINSYKSEGENTAGLYFASKFGKEQEFNVDLLKVGEFYQEILELTDQHIKKMEKENLVGEIRYGLPFCEKITTRMPIVVDMLLKFDDANSSVLYGSDFIVSCVQCIQKVIQDMIYCNDKDGKDLFCFVLESDIWHDDNIEYQKIRFQFPYTGITPEIMRSTFYPQIINELKYSKIINKLHDVPIEADWSKIIIPVDKYLSLYGSKIKQNECLLKLRSVFESTIEFYIDDVENEINEPYYIDYESYDLIDPLECSLIQDGSFQETYDFGDNDKEYSLPLILSVFFYDKFSKIKNDAILITPMKKVVNQTKQKNYFIADENHQEIFDELIQYISPERCDPNHRHSWYKIGKILHNIFNGSNLGLEKWINVSHESLKTECSTHWDNFSSEFLDNRTLMEFVKEDNPEFYTEWHKSYYTPYIDPSLRGKNMCIADLASRVLVIDVLYDRENKIWYRKKKSRIMKDIGCCELRELLRNKLKNIFFDVKNNYEKSKAEDVQTNARQKFWDVCIKEIDCLLDKFDDVSFLDIVIRALTSKMFDDAFSTNKDENLNTIACTNVVLEVYDNTICYRSGLIQDYITKCTNIAFPISYTIETKQVLFLLKYFSQVHCEPRLYYDDHDHNLCKSKYCDQGICHGEMCHFILKDNASVLLGGNEEKRFRNFIGESNASKSQVIKLFQEALGDYCVDFPNEAITVSRQKTSGGPDPALEQAKGTRMAIVAETDKSEPLHAAKIKKYTGNDRYWNRSLNKEGGSRVLSFKLYHMSNVISPPENPDEAYNMREFIYPHLCKWEENPPEDEIEQYRQRRFKADPGFTKRIKSLAQAMLFLMYTYFDDYKEEGISILPEVVKQKTKEHQDEINPYLNFIKENLVANYIEDGSCGENRCLDENISMSLTTMFNNYKKWYPTFSPESILKVNQSSFKKEMLKKDRLGKLNEFNEWTGISFRKRNNDNHRGQ